MRDGFLGRASHPRPGEDPLQRGVDPLLGEPGEVLPGFPDVQVEVSVAEAADVIWSTNSPEFFALLVHDRGWAPERFERWLAAAWKRLLLREPWASAPARP